MILAGFVVAQMSLNGEATSFDDRWKPIVGYAPVVVLLLITLIPRGPLSRVLALRPFVFVGERSYSLYLLQGLAALVVASVVPRYGVPSTETLIASVLVGLMISDLMYRWVEQPMIRYGHRVTDRFTAPARTSAGTHARGGPARDVHTARSSELVESVPTT